MGLKTFLAEIASIKRLFSKKNLQSRKIVFYSEGSIYYLYFEGFISYILNNSEHSICYITSDPDDPVFKLQSERFKVFYISNLMLAFVTVFLDSKVLLMTMTDLDRFHIKRSTKNVNHIYIFHAILSTHMVYQKGAFDQYDTIFCAGQHHFDEIRSTEEFYHLKLKQLVKVGYPLLEKLYDDHKEFQQTRSSKKNNCQMVLIAPSWSRGNIIEVCIDDLIPLLLESGYKVVLRPHPEIFKKNKNKLKAIVEKYGREENFIMENMLTSTINFHEADVLITDWSGIAFEYAFGTEKPVLFINTLRKVHNIDYEKINIEPIEIKLRNGIGVSLEVEGIQRVIEEVKYLISNRNKFRKNIIELRDYYVYNWGYSSEVGGEYILQYINNKI